MNDSSPRRHCPRGGLQETHGQVSLMIGMKNRELHCTDGLSHGSLRLCKTRFSPGWVLTVFSTKLGATSRWFLSKMVGLPQDSSVPRLVEAATKV